MKAASRHIIVFTRAAIAGEAKTRLIPVLGAEGAAVLHLEMMRRTLAVVDLAAATCGASFEFRYTGADRERMARDLPAVRNLLPQSAGDLGARIDQATNAAFARGARAVVVIGTDCPALDARHLRTLFDAIDRSPLAIIPALDGGYVAIGLASPAPSLFDAIEWSTPQVLDQTLERARAARLDAVLLDPLADVDRPADLHHWYGRRPLESSGDDSEGSFAIARTLVQGG